jgi:hypothetical protein
MTIPDATPGASAPFKPILFSTPWRAIGLSVARNADKELLWRGTCCTGDVRTEDKLPRVSHKRDERIIFSNG